MNGHLNARLCPRALEDDVEAIFLAELGQCILHVFFYTSKLLFGGFGLVHHGQAVDFGCESVVFSKVEACLIDVDGDDA